MTRGAVQTLTDTATFVVLHPVRSALRVLGVAKGVVETATGRGWTAEPEPVPGPVAVPVPAQPPVAAVPPQRVPEPEPRPAAEQIPPGQPGESFVTEPSALSHDDAHGDSSAQEDWEDELDDGAEAPTPLDMPSHEPLLDPSLTKQIKGDLDRGLRDADQ